MPLRGRETGRLRRGGTAAGAGGGSQCGDRCEQLAAVSDLRDAQADQIVIGELRQNSASMSLSRKAGV
jgi:hypothetical protein